MADNKSYLLANFGNSESGPFDRHLEARFIYSNRVQSADHASNFAAGPLDGFTILFSTNCGHLYMATKGRGHQKHTHLGGQKVDS